jgi:hypothetical protein
MILAQSAPRTPREENQNIEARNPKLETDPKHEIKTNHNVSNKRSPILSFEFSEFEIYLVLVCLGFRYSDFGFGFFGI